MSVEQRMIKNGKRSFGAGHSSFFFVGCATLALIAATPVLAQDDVYPRIDGEVAVEFAGNHVRQGNNKQNDINPTIELAAGWIFSPSFSVQSSFTLESVYGGSQDFFSRDLALSTDEVYLQYETEMFRLFGGKVSPTFGTAWDITPGVYGTTLSEEYELGLGYIAAGVGLTFDTALGKNILTGTAFRLDRSILSQTAITSADYGDGRTQRALASGGVANHRGIKSFSVTLDSSDVFGLKGLNSHLGYRKQARGVDNNADETGLVGGLSASYDLSAQLKMELMGEYADFSNYGGEKDHDASYMTVGAAFAYNSYSLALAYTLKDDNGSDTEMLSASIGTEVWNEWALDVGYALTKSDDEKDVHAIGFTLAKAFEFSSGQ